MSPNKDSGALITQPCREPIPDLAPAPSQESLYHKQADQLAGG